MTGDQKLNRQIAADILISASVSDVWQAWTTTAGVTSFFAPQANIDLRIGGEYELYFMPDAEAGSRGAEGTKVLSFLPEKMLSFEWNVPPSVPVLRNAGMTNWVVIIFEDQGADQVRLRLTHLGWGEGDDWDACFAYFENTWPQVLQACRDYFEGPDSA